MKTVLICTIDNPLGARVAQLLSHSEKHRKDTPVQVIGMSHTASIEPSPWLRMQTPPLTGHQLAEFLRAERVDVVVQTEVAGEGRPAPDYETALQQYVIGSMLLLGACVAGGVRRVVLRSSTLVYGAHPRQPAFIAEGSSFYRSQQSRLIRNYIEVDTFASEFARKHPNLEIVILRCAPIVGDGFQSPLVHYLTQPRPRVILGFNPRTQLLHPEDAARAFALAARGTTKGAFNLAADDPLKLTQVIRLAGQQPIPLPAPLLTAAAGLGYEQAILGAWPFGAGFLRYSCVGDIRRAHQELQWQPEHPAKNTVCGLVTAPRSSLRQPDLRIDIGS